MQINYEFLHLSDKEIELFQEKISKIDIGYFPFFDDADYENPDYIDATRQTPIDIIVSKMNPDIPKAVGGPLLDDEAYDIEFTDDPLDDSLDEEKTFYENINQCPRLYKDEEPDFTIRPKTGKLEYDLDHQDFKIRHADPERLVLTHEPTDFYFALYYAAEE